MRKTLDGMTGMQTPQADAPLPPPVEKAFSRQTWMSAAGLLVATTLLSKVLGFLRDVLVAQYFGTGEQVDAFMVAVALPVMVGGVGLALSTAFIPIYRRVLVEKGSFDARSLSGAAAALTLALSGIAMAVIIAVPAQLIGLVAPALPSTTAALAAQLVRWLSLLTVGVNLFYILVAIYNAMEHFKVPAFSDLLSNVCVVGALFLLSGTLGIGALALGLIGGYLVVVGVMILPILRRRLVSFGASFWSAELRQLIVLAGPICFIEVLSQATTVIENHFGAVVGPGAISALGFAKRLMLVVITLLANNIARAVFPALSGLTLERDLTEAREFFVRLIHHCLVVFVPISVFFMYFREDLIRLIYMRGAFDEISVANTSAALLYYSMGIVPLAIVPIFTRACYAFSDSRTPLLAALLGVVVMATLNVLLAPMFGLVGIACAASLAQLPWLALMGVVLARRFGGIEFMGLFRTSVLAVTCSAVAMSAVAGLRASGVLRAEDMAPAILAMGFYVGAYVCVGWVLMQRDMRVLWGMVRCASGGARNG